MFAFVPVCMLSWQVVMMSISGPPDLCAMTTSPAAIISTIEIPKCSFHILNTTHTSMHYNMKLRYATVPYEPV